MHCRFSKAPMYTNIHTYIHIFRYIYLYIYVHALQILRGIVWSEGRVYPSIDWVCCGNIWKETNKCFDPNKLSVGNSLRVSRGNPQTQSSNSRAWVFFEYQTTCWFDWDREILSHVCRDKLKLDWRTGTTLNMCVYTNLQCIYVLCIFIVYVHTP